MASKQRFLLGAIPVLIAASLSAGQTHSVERNQSKTSDSILEIGLGVWRKPGAIDEGAACATCHSPDGIELAAYRFDDADIIRRATPHLGLNDARVIVQYIHALRVKFNINHLRDPSLDRPLQPGGQVLPGKTPADRDFAFGKELEEKLPRLFGQPIETIDEAKAAEKELLAIQPVNLRVGIPMNRLSEDVAHGNVHSSIAQWLPEEPPTVKPVDQPAWYAAEDDYLGNPTQGRLHNLLVLQRKLVDSSHMMGLGVLSDMKFRALLIWQDRLRSRSESRGQDEVPEVATVGGFNPIWDVGEQARDILNRNAAAIGMDPATQKKKLAGPSLGDQLHSLRLSWFWLGWLSDQGLFKTNHDDKVRFGLWLSQSLSEDGPYPMHNVYSNVRRQAVVSNDPAAWGEPTARKRRIWDFAGLRSFDYQDRDIPREPAYRDLYVRFTANCFRMNLLLLKDDIERNGVVWVKVSTKANIAVLVRFIASRQPAEAAGAEALKSDLYRLVDSAKERF